MSDPLRARLLSAAHPDEESFRDSLRSFVDRHLLPIEMALDRGEGNAQADLLRASKEARRLGISPLNLPMSAGGPGLPLWAQVVVREELGYSTMAAATSVKRPPLALLAAESQEVREVVQGVADGSNEVAFALSEAQSSSTFHGTRSRITSTPAGFRLDGVKEFVSGAPTATHLLVFARDEEVSGQAVSACLVPTSASGVTITPRPKISWRGYPWATVTLSGVPLTDSAIVGARGDGARLAMQDIAATRLGVAAHYLGTTVRLLSLTLRWAEVREIGPGAMLAGGQGFRWQFARLASRFLAVRAMVQGLARSQGESARGETSAAKLLASELVSESADFAVQAYGASGLDEENIVSVLYRDARAFRIGEGTTEVQLETIARNFVGG